MTLAFGYLPTSHTPSNVALQGCFSSSGLMKAVVQVAADLVWDFSPSSVAINSGTQIQCNLTKAIVENNLE